MNLNPELLFVWSVENIQMFVLYLENKHKVMIIKVIKEIWGLKVVFTCKVDLLLLCNPHSAHAQCITNLL